MKTKSYIVGIAGGSASGKTTFLRDLQQMFPRGAVSVISQDNYYYPKEMQAVDEAGQINFDLPTAINRKEFFEDLKKLTQGDTVMRPEYGFNALSKEPSLVVTQPAPIIVMEGLFVFHYEEIREMLDLKVYIDVLDDIKLERRIVRDAIERGYNERAVRYQWDNHVVPSYKKFLRPYRDSSDIIITNNINYNKGLEVLVNHLKVKVAEQIPSAQYNQK
jgi:uridine kinase